MPVAGPGGSAERPGPPSPAAKTLYSPAQEQVVALLREARRRQGLTQRELAGRLSRSPDYVARLESGQQRVEIVEWLRFLQACQADPVTFLRRLVEAAVFDPPLEVALPVPSRPRRRRAPP